MKIALIKNGIVENVIVGTPEFGQSLGYSTVRDVTNIQCGVGYTFANETFTAPEPAQENVTDIKASLAEQIAQLQQQLNALE